MSRVVWDPPEGLAIARCQLARFADPRHRTTPAHPSSCQWCPWPDAEIDRLVRGFNAWADRDRHGVYGAHEVRVFREQSPEVQRAQIEAAQALTGVAWQPEQDPTAGPADGEPDRVGGSDSSAITAGQGPLRNRVGSDPGSNVSVPPPPTWLDA